MIVIAALSAWAAPVLAQSNEPLGERFISICRSPTDAGRDACGGVVTALMNAHVEMARQNPNKRFICPPRILTIEEGRRVFLQWADITPEALTMHFPHLVMVALVQRYPCSQFIVPK
jgi:hypothetical protein